MENIRLFERQGDRGRFDGQETRLSTVTGTIGPETISTSDPPSTIATTEGTAAATVDPNAVTAIGTGSEVTSTAEGITTSILSTTSSSAATKLSDNAIAQSASNSGTSTMSNGGIAAAVVVPVLLLAFIAVVLVLLRRRRRRLRKQETATNFVQNMQQRNTPQQQYNATASAAPNTAYYTGLDTSDHTSYRESGRSFDEVPPPPYIKNAQPQTPAAPLIVAPDNEARSLSSWRTAPNQPVGENRLSAVHQDTSRQSISSTAYTDSASLHSARAARMSLGSAQIISTIAGHNRNSSARSIDPFDDPDSPVSSVGGDETRAALHGLDISRGVSPISFASRRNDI